MSQGEIILYQTDDGIARIECRFVDESIWLTQRLIAELYGKDVRTINEHIVNIVGEGELDAGATIRKFRIVQTEGLREVAREVEHYSLEAILAIGYRVRSPRGTAFRQWATARLSEYLVKGFTMDDARLKAAGGGQYFEELLARIRDIRSSEKVFWRKVLDIYATSIDYDPRTEASELFFKTVQNKMHWAAHGHTAAEIIAGRADATKDNMGLASWAGSRPRKGDVGVAKNYLGAEELELLNRIVTAYLEFAELQALNRRPMPMADWITKLDEFLKASGRELLTHAGKISHEVALLKAESEYDAFEKKRLAEPTKAEKDFEEAAKRLKQIPRKPKPRAKKTRNDPS